MLDARVDAKGYLRGAPELVVEITASTVSLDPQPTKGWTAPGEAGSLRSHRQLERESLPWRIPAKMAPAFELIL
jgi:hypothetical protein